MPVGELRIPDDVFGRLRLWLRVLSVCLSELPEGVPVPNIKFGRCAALQQRGARHHDATGA